MVVKYHLVVARQSAGAQPARPRPRSPLPSPRCRPRRPPPAAPSSCPGSGSDPGTAASSMSGALLLRVPHRPEDSPAENGQRRRVGCLLASLGAAAAPRGRSFINTGVSDEDRTHRAKYLSCVRRGRARS